jgi:hypothetical protein
MQRAASGQRSQSSAGHSAAATHREARFWDARAIQMRHPPPPDVLSSFLARAVP